MFNLFFYSFSIFILFLTLALVWYLLIYSFIVIKSKSDFLSNKVVNVTTNYWAEAFQVFLAQLNWLSTRLKMLYNFLKTQQESSELEKRKLKVMYNVASHLNERLEEATNIKTVYPATVGNDDIWVYLSNKLSTQEKIDLENYFIGVLSKYTSEFALDRMAIELNAGAGWVAKFDVKIISEAQYNRMARASEVIIEELYDKDDIIW
nr:MAG TPA: hypothetical protein [Caudoviricetes sp.]